MTEWERSHGDKGEGGREREADEGGERGGFELMLSPCLCDDCHRGSLGLWFNTMADNDKADGQMVLYVREDLCECICMHVCASGAQASMSVKSSSRLKL